MSESLYNPSKATKRPNLTLSSPFTIRKTEVEAEDENLPALGYPRSGRPEVSGCMDAVGPGCKEA